MGPLAEPIRVLVVDDDPDVRSLTCDVLGELSDRLTVHAVETVRAAQDRLATDDVDCVVSDYEMEPIDGIEFLATVREADPELPFILFTGRGSEAVASEAISAGVTDYVQKRGGLDQYELLLNRIEDAVESVRSQVSYREVFEKADVGLTIRDTETGELLDANERYCEMLGYERAELTALGFDELTADVDGFDPERARTHLERVEDEGTHTFLWPDETSDGDVVWVEVSISIAEIEGRERYFASVRDVTEHKRRADELDAARRRYEAVFNSPVAFTGILAVDGTLLDANDAALAFVDADREEVVGEPFAETPWWTHSEDLRDDLRRWIERAAAGEHVRYEADHVGPDGETVTIDGVIHPIEDDGEVVSLLITGRDISQRRDRERRITAIHEATQRFADANDPDAVAEIAVELLSDVLGHDATVVRWYDPATDRLVPNTVSERAQEAGGTRPEYPVENSLAGRTFHRGEPGVYEDVEAVGDPHDHGEARSVMYLPLGPHGTLSVVDTDVDAFGETDVELAGAIAENARAALDRLGAEPVAQQEPEHQRAVDVPSVAVAAWQRVDPTGAELAVETEATVRAPRETLDHLLAALLRRALGSRGIESGDPVRTATGPEAVLTGDREEADARPGDGPLGDPGTADGTTPLTVRIAERPDRDGLTVTANPDGDVDAPSTRLAPSEAPPTPRGVDEALAAGITTAAGWDLLVAEGPDGGLRFDLVGLDPA